MMMRQAKTKDKAREEAHDKQRKGKISVPAAELHQLHEASLPSLAVLSSISHPHSYALA
jgi:hypothetical protein